MKYLSIFLLLFSFLTSATAQTKNILMIVAPVEFRDEELFIPKKYLKIMAIK